MDAASSFEVPRFIGFTIGMVVFFLGASLTRRVPLLRDYNIPEAVSGGLVVAVLTWLLFVSFHVEVTFELEIRDTLLVIFFATIGLNARFADFLAGGRLLVFLFAASVVVIVIQNLIGLLGTAIFGLPSAVGVLLGSAAFVGGHATEIAWVPTVEARSGFTAGLEVGTAIATLGLIAAAVAGGPVAKFLIDRKRLAPTSEDGPIVGLPHEDDEDAADTPDDGQNVNHVNLMRALLATNVAVIIGYAANSAIEAAGLTLPLFVVCLLVGMLMSNTVPLLFPRLPWPSRTPALAIISDYSLSVFLAMSLMSLQLWALSGLGIALIAVVAVQVLFVVLLAPLVVFRLMGSDYTAAVFCAGFVGDSLGSTSTAIASMSAVAKRYGPAPLAFVILPLVSAVLVNTANAFIISFFVAL